MVPVHVHVTTVAEARAAGVLARYQAALTPEERTRHARMRADPRGDEFLVGRALIHRALARHAPGGATLATAAYGRLELSGAPGAGISFNLSHAAGMVVCAVATGVDVGADVEKVDPRRADDAIWEQFFAPPEIAALSALPAAERCERFFTYWTLKESYIKARGLGLQIPLHDFWFLIAPPRPIRIAFAPTLDDDPRRWQFLQHRLPGDHLLAVAATSGDEPIALTIEEGLP